MIAVVLIVAALVISNILSREITQPIQRLKDSMALVQEGNFQVGNVEVESNNEIGSLTETFHTMTCRIQELMDEYYQ